MNYYPYYNFVGMPYNNVANRGLFRRLFGNINFTNILNGTQKTINFVNQTIPMVKQISPFIKNTKTMFKVMNEFKKNDTPLVKNNKESSKIEKVVPLSTTDNNSPTFFI